MNIATALNKKYVPYTGVMLYSMAVNNACHIDVYLLHSELDAGDFSFLESCVSSFDVTLHPLQVDRTRFSDRIPRTEQWSLETYFRLLLLELLPPQTDRLLYLDVDIIVNGSLEAFYSSPLDGYDLIACADACGKRTPESYGPKHREMFAPTDRQGLQYFCAGVTLFHISRMREKYSFQTYLDAMEAWDYGMEAPDQDILNWVHLRHTGYADPWVYNLFARVAHNDNITYEQVKQDGIIIHFAGDKPWESTNVHYDIEKLWWDYACKTPAYKALLTDFMESSLCDNKRIEDYIRNLEQQNSQLEQNLGKVMQMLKSLSRQ